MGHCPLRGLLAASSSSCRLFPAIGSIAWLERGVAPRAALLLMLTDDVAQPGFPDFFAQPGFPEFFEYVQRPPLAPHLGGRMAIRTSQEGYGEDRF